MHEPQQTPIHRFVPAASILTPPDRQRQEFDPAALLELASSIRLKELLHAITVRPDGRTLVAGERRLRAIRDHIYPLGGSFSYGGEPVPAGMVPVVAVATDDPLALEEIECDENLRRKDLTWQERAAVTARLNALRQKQAARTGATYTTADLAREVNKEKVEEAEAKGLDLGDLQNVPRLEVIVARHLSDPEVASAKTLKDAFKVLKKKEEAKRVADLGAAMGAATASEMHSIYHANCINWMERYLESEGPKFDVILTDPPYGMGADSFGDGAGRLATIEHNYDDSYESWKALMASWCPLSYAITGFEAHAYVFCDFDRFHELKRMMDDAGWYVFRTPLVNFKRNSGRVPLPEIGPRRQYELILYAIKGKKRTTAIYSDVIESNADEQLSHGAQKPVALYSNLLRRSCRPGDLTLDTFGGTGTLLPAAHDLKCKAVVVEQNPVSYGLCVERLKGLSG